MKLLFQTTFGMFILLIFCNLYYFIFLCFCSYFFRSIMLQVDPAQSISTTGFAAAAWKRRGKIGAKLGFHFHVFLISSKLPFWFEVSEV